MITPLDCGVYFLYIIQKVVLKHIIEVIITWFFHALFWCTIFYLIGSLFLPHLEYIDVLTFVSFIGTLKLFFNKKTE